VSRLVPDEVKLNVELDTEKLDTKVQKIKDHFRNNKKAYLVGVGGVALGLSMGRHGEVKQIIDAFKIQINSPTTNQITTNITRRGHPGDIWRNNVTGEVAASLRRLAEIDSVSRPFIKSHAGGPEALYSKLGEAS